VILLATIILPLVAFALLGARLYVGRLTHSDEWRAERLHHFIMNVELPTVCEVTGEHALTDLGCENCEDILALPVIWHEGGDWIDVENRSQFYDKADPRVLRLVATEINAYGVGRGGYALCDPSRKSKEAGRYTHASRDLPEARVDPYALRHSILYSEAV
jgi:hypothetical protein